MAPQGKRYKKCAHAMRFSSLAPGEAKALNSPSPVQARDKEPMSFLAEVALGDGFPPFAAFYKELGFIPNLLRAQSLLPSLIEAQATFEKAVRLNPGAISRAQKERILLCVAADRGDVYCAGLARAALLLQGEPEHRIPRLLQDHTRVGLAARDAALLDFCRKLASCPISVSSFDVDRLRQQGTEDESIIEAAVTTALGVYRCTLSVGLHPEPEKQPWNLPPGTKVPLTEAAGSARRPRKGPYVHAPYLSPLTFAPFATLMKSHGFIPNFFRAQTLRPDLLAAEAELSAAILLSEDTLTRMQKEAILLAVSAVNLNSYCVAVHCNLLRGLGLSADEGDQIAVDHHRSSLSEADKALLDFAIKLGAGFAEFSLDDVDRLRAVGFTDAQILECEVVTALNNFANFLQMGLGIEPDFEPPFAFEQKKAHQTAVSFRLIQEGSGASSAMAPVEDPDAELTAHARAGSLEAFEELIRRHSRLVYRALAAILGNQDHAQDAMQDVMLSAYQNIAAFQSRSKFSTWLVSIARNKAIEYLRKRKKEISLDEAPFGEDEDFRPREVRDWVDNPEQAYSRREIRQLIERGIMGLPAKYRTVVMLRDVELLSIEEIARQLGLSVPAVKVRLFRGRLMLREWLAPYFAASVRRATE
jgi:RNA polymerase sigma-70 factor, ECF subfamily